MHELIEGLKGVEVIADDIVVVSFGGTLDKAVKDHDHNLERFLMRCAARGVKFNAEKLKLRMREVPFIGHVATDRGLCADPAKVRAITDMSKPTDVAAIQPTRDDPIPWQVLTSFVRCETEWRDDPIPWQVLTSFVHCETEWSGET